MTVTNYMKNNGNQAFPRQSSSYFKHYTSLLYAKLYSEKGQGYHTILYKFHTQIIG
jgi:hypothetical protein